MISPLCVYQVDGNFIEMLGLKQSLTPSRNNGFLNMLRLMQKKSMEISVATAPAAAGDPSPAPASPAANGTDVVSASPTSSPSSSNGGASHSNGSGSGTPVQDGVRRKLTEALNPQKVWGSPHLCSHPP